MIDKDDTCVKSLMEMLEWIIDYAYFLNNKVTAGKAREKAFDQFIKFEWYVLVHYIVLACFVIMRYIRVDILVLEGQIGYTT